MRQRKILNVLCAVALAALLAAEGMTLLLINRLGMLPVLYMSIVGAIFLLVGALVGLLMFLPGKKAKGRVVRKVIACALALLMCLGCAGISSVVADVNDTINAITDTPNQKNGVTMAVYVLAEDPAQNIADAADYSFGIVTGYETERTEKTIAAVEAELGTKVKTASYATIYEMVDALYSGELKALILNSAYVTLMEEQEGYEDYSVKTRILFETVIEETPQVEPTDPSETVDPDATEPTVVQKVENITNTPFVMYVSGSDTRSYMLTTSRSDVNILMVVNPETKQILLINTPRDYFVPNPAGGGIKDKLTHCGIYGITTSMQALADLYDVDVNYYGQINFTGFEILIDAIGGVDVYSDESFGTGDYYYSQGENHLNGKEALAFARDRYHVSGGDSGRGRHQMALIEAVIGKVTSGTTIITQYAEILDSLQGMLSTNFTNQEIGDLVKMQLSDMASWDIQSYSVSGIGGSDITYSMPGEYVYVMYPDQTMVDYGAELIDRVMAGEILISEDMTCPGE